ncbi:MAG TPA: glutaredoxin family protein [Steroidobacteraceae bacterium]|nr:glutaredoxin family protein [Steroidobacteraceae bacterium]
MPATSQTGGARLLLVQRPGCGLCEEMLAALERLSRSLELPAIELIDVESDTELNRRYGLNVPVLLLDGTVVCRHRLDAPELLRLLRASGPAQR